ncbi:MAG TPA: P1 family peptidase [Planctomycetota bacterium]|nr:P1 family peptidase [Planctomycetota bacterium]
MAIVRQRFVRLWPAVALLAACAVPPHTAPAPSPAADALATTESTGPRQRARDLGIHIGALSSGPHDAITDVAGVAVGHATVRRGGDQPLNTGVTVILPHGGNPFAEKVPAALHVMNGFGKLMGGTQVQELGELETPIALCATLNVARVADGVLDWLLALPGNESVRSANVVVGETNDGRLSDIRARAVTAQHVTQAIASAGTGAVAVGSVGAGAGTVCFGWKGGIGTSSRRVGDFTVGVLVQTNFGGSLVVDGVPADAFLRAGGAQQGDDEGSCMIVIATDAPLDAAALRRLAARSFAGMARTGASFSHGSGDYAIAFSTARELRIRHGSDRAGGTTLRGDELSKLFTAVADATEQAILDSLCAAETTAGVPPHVVHAVPLDRLQQLLRERKQRQP